MEHSKKNVYFGFSAGMLDIALPIENVIKVVPIPELKYLPNLPESVIGLLNYHGEIIPVFDLRIKFNLTNREIGIDNRILLGEKNDFKFGIVTTKIIGNLDNTSKVRDTDIRLKQDHDIPGEYISFNNDLIYLADPMKFLFPEEKTKLLNMISS